MADAGEWKPFRAEWEFMKGCGTWVRCTAEEAMIFAKAGCPVRANHPEPPKEPS